MLTMNNYIVTMHHDNGTIRIQTNATSTESAAAIVCKFEHAPPSAVVSVKPAQN